MWTRCWPAAISAAKRSVKSPIAHPSGLVVPRGRLIRAASRRRPIGSAHRQGRRPACGRDAGRPRFRRRIGERCRIMPNRKPCGIAVPQLPDSIPPYMSAAKVVGLLVDEMAAIRYLGVEAGNKIGESPADRALRTAVPGIPHRATQHLFCREVCPILVDQGVLHSGGLVLTDPGRAPQARLIPVIHDVLAVWRECKRDNFTIGPLHVEAQRALVGCAGLRASLLNRSGPGSDGVSAMQCRVGLPTHIDRSASNASSARALGNPRRWVKSRSRDRTPFRPPLDRIHDLLPNVLHNTF
jgi:hypothetical protein